MTEDKAPEPTGAETLPAETEPQRGTQERVIFSASENEIKKRAFDEQHSVLPGELEISKRAFEEQLSVLSEFQKTARFALDLYAPAVAHVIEFQRIAQSSGLLANKNLIDAMARSVLTEPTLRIVQEAAQSAAWATILARSAMPPAPLIANLTNSVSVLSLDLAKHINLNASILGDTTFLKSAASLGRLRA